MSTEGQTIPEDIMKAVQSAWEKAWSKTGSTNAESIRDAIEIAILAERERHQWQTIESAPKDETQILLYGVCRKPSVDAGKPAIVIGYWIDFNTGGWVWYGASMEFTHWMPLPAAPKAEG